MNHRIIFVVLLILIRLSVSGQSLEDLMKSYDDFEERTGEEFEAFRRRTQKEFGEFLIPLDEGVEDKRSALRRGEDDAR